MNIIINGAVAVGKSFVFDLIEKHLSEKLKLPCVIYPEFIYNDILASELVVKRFTKEIDAISPLTFQSYIMDKWKFYAKKWPYDAEKYNVFERLPEDAVEVFAKGCLDHDAYKTQINALEEVKKLLPVSYYSMNSADTIWIIYHNDWMDGADHLPTLFDEIDKQIYEQKYKNLVIEIRSSHAFKNCQFRHRRGEENYTENDIKTLVETYRDYTDGIRKIIGCETIII